MVGKATAVKWFAAANLAGVGVVTATIYEQYGYAFSLLSVAFFCTLMMLFHQWKSWVTLSHLFLVAFTLYTLSGPFEVLFVSGKLPPFSPPFHVREWFADAALALIGFTWGMLFLRFAYQLRQAPELRDIEYVRVALVLMFFASMSEVINLMRAGGIAVLLTDKAVYQAAIADISLTLPAPSFALLAFAFWGIGYASRHKQRRAGQVRGVIRFADLLVVATSAPLLFTHIVAGQRSEIVSYFVAFLLGYTYRKHVWRLQTRVIVGFLLVYFLISPLYGFRSLIPMWLSGKAVELPTDVVWKRLFTSLNPALNEFGSSFGNYSTMMQAGISELHYGTTFLRGLTVVIPSFLYPGEKPVSPTYEFRDRFFAEWSQRSAISGTAFSSLLEARMNFGDVGPLVVFFAMGSLFALIEILRNRSSSPWFAAFYCCFGQFALLVHRSDVGSALSSYLWIVSILVLVWCGVHIWINRR